MSPPPVHVVLVVDGDGVSRRFAELAFGRQGWSVESARDGNGAAEILETTLVDAIVSERTLPDMEALRLHRRLLQSPRLRTVPFVIWSADARVESVTAALRSGVNDYLPKPIDAKVLVAKVEALVQREARFRDATRSRTYLLAGDFHTLAFPDLLSTLALQRRTGSLSVVGERAGGEVVLHEGELVHAAYGSLVGPPAFQAIFEEPRGRFEFTPQHPGEVVGARTMEGSVNGAIMDAARVQDETARRGTAERPTPPPLPARPPSTLPDPQSATHFIQGIADGFSLGELFLWLESELAAWLKRDAQSERLHVHLVAEPAIGLAGMLAMAAPPGVRPMVTSLRPGHKTAGLVYFLKHERLLDLVLVDLEGPASQIHALTRRPALTIIAPPHGDFLSIGPRSAVGIQALLRIRPADLLVGVGSPGSAEALARLGPGIPSVLVPGALDDGRTELREVLCRALEGWAETRFQGAP